MSIIRFTAKLSAIGCLCLAFAGAVSAQNGCPQGFICLTQSEANKAAANALTVIAQEKEIAVLKTSLDEKDASIRQLKETNDKNVADLKNQLNDVTVKYATAQGQLIGAEASVTRLSAIIDFMLKNGRVKQNGLINVKF